MMDVSVENIIVSFPLALSLDLQKLAGILPDADYNPDEAPAVVLHFKKPRSVVTLFSTGSVMVTGPKNMDEVHEVITMVSDRLSVAGEQPQAAPEIKVENVTASTDLNRLLNLADLAKSLKTVEYDMKVFPGLIYHGDNPNTVLLLFDSGKIVCNGSSLEEVTFALNNLMEKLLSFGIKKEENICPKYE